MLASWTKLLPFFVIEMLARKHCPLIHIGEVVFHEVYGRTGPGLHARPGDELVLIEANARDRGSC